MMYYRVIVCFAALLLPYVFGKPNYFIIGMQKAGTTSFHELFTKLGLKSAHYVVPEGPVAGLIYKAKSEGLPLTHYLQDYDAITEMNHDSPTRSFHCYYPQIEDIKQLYEENKNATFILNLRDVDAQINSMMKTCTGPNILAYCRKYIPTGGLKELIESHNEKIRTFFALRPEANFVEFQIEQGNMSELSQYLKNTEAITFPIANARLRI